ncbi:Uma2 family endonuclease [Nonomuraea sp. NPDC049709]|uniref:Uma2 family endonuclease n=1 Tax=Nonomuraea sp. NPDC049709 TaxID=3154736 RepID=UPI003415C9E8
MATIEPAGPRVFPLGNAPYTVDDLLKFPDDGNRYELFNGSLLVSPALTPLHQRVIFRMQQILDEALPPDLEPLSTVNLRVTDRDFYIPDLVVVREDSVETVGLMFSPRDLLLAVEIGSPSTSMHDEGLKSLAYARAGIPSYWRIEPGEGPALYVYELNDYAYDPPAVYKAGSVAQLKKPCPISFDPGVLVLGRN